MLTFGRHPTPKILLPRACEDGVTGVLTRIVDRHPNRDIDQLLPCAYRTQSFKAVA